MFGESKKEAGPWGPRFNGRKWNVGKYYSLNV
ncbi:Hypothetical protein Bdt_0628 [Bdellovibrio bacteriovorus str. Tiberius]|uniref:Uncharacterized protein n=1 Tax=Bdellovibrio bacteriovorus str. Tiberius TaxID=1069642 RepID=K7YKR4_BDEBC|nr:Hypothetical protein Bdt_0628 [Bdellovibrio bacteriovorus str. Tiberius]